MSTESVLEQCRSDWSLGCLMLPIDEKSAVELPLGGIRIHATIRLLHRFGSWWLKESETYADIGGYVE